MVATISTYIPPRCCYFVTTTNSKLELAVDTGVLRRWCRSGGAREICNDGGMNGDTSIEAQILRVNVEVKQRRRSRRRYRHTYTQQNERNKEKERIKRETNKQTNEQEQHDFSSLIFSLCVLLNWAKRNNHVELTDGRLWVQTKPIHMNFYIIQCYIERHTLRNVTLIWQCNVLNNKDENMPCDFSKRHYALT